MTDEKGRSILLDEVAHAPKPKRKKVSLSDVRIAVANLRDVPTTAVRIVRRTRGLTREAHLREHWNGLDLLELIEKARAKTTAPPSIGGSE